MLNAQWDVGSAASKEAIASYRVLLGIPEGEPFKDLCSACSVVWFYKGGYGVGTPTEEQINEGGRWVNRSLKWHERFKRHFLPKGEYQTCPVGNLEHKITKISPKKEDYLEEERPDASISV